MNILAIDTSCDETAAAVTSGRKVLGNSIYSQISLHEKWGGVVPNLARRAHEDHIDKVVAVALKKAGMTMRDIGAIAVTQGPGLAIALGVGIDTAVQLAKEHKKKLIAVNHMEGHIYSCFTQNSAGKPNHEIVFPLIAMLVSGNHTELVVMKEHLDYEIIGETLDDAAGEALDKAARLLLGTFVYPGGPIVERLALQGDPNYYPFPKPLARYKDLSFSYSGLKTSLLYALKKMTEQEKKDHLNDMAASFQKAVVKSLIDRLTKAMERNEIMNVIVAGGVAINRQLRKEVRKAVADLGGTVLFPPYKYLNSDNAAMIGVVAGYKAEKGMFVDNPDDLERNARLRLVAGERVGLSTCRL